MYGLIKASARRLLKPRGKKKASKEAKAKHDISRILARNHQGQFCDSATTFEWGLTKSSVMLASEIR